MRTFIAIALPSEIKHKIAEIQRELQSCNCAATWVKPENLHLTLKFLGDITDTRADEVKMIIYEAARQFKAFKASWGDFGFFPNERRPRVFFLSTHREELLRSLADCLQEKLTAIGFERENKFKSHLTLARIKGPKNIDCLKKKLSSISLEGYLPVDEITFFKSTLTPRGPIYEIIARSPLAI